MRSEDGFGPLTLVLAPRGPLSPSALRLGERLHRFERRRRLQVRSAMRQGEGHRLAGLHREVAHGPEVFAFQRCSGAQDDHVWTGHRAQASPILQMGDPRSGDAVVEAHHQLGVHGDLAAATDDQANQIRTPPFQRHKIDERHRPVLGLVLGFQNQRPVAVTPLDTGARIVRRDQPATVLWSPQQGGEYGPGVEPRPAEPIDGASSRNQGRGVAVSDQRVVLNPGRGAAEPVRQCSGPRSHSARDCAAHGEGSVRRAPGLQ